MSDIDLSQFEDEYEDEDTLQKLKELIESIKNFDDHYESVTPSMLAVLKDVIDTTMDTYFLYLVENLIEKYRSMMPEEREAEYIKAINEMKQSRI